MFNGFISLFARTDLLSAHAYVGDSSLLLNLLTLSNILIFLAYLSISISLAYLIHKRQELNFKLALWLSAAFIFACSITHLLHAVIHWYPWYWLQASFDVLTAFISVYAALYLWQILAQLVHFPKLEHVLQINQQLQSEINQRKAIEETLRQEIVFSKTLMNSLPGIFYRLDTHGCLVGWNDNFSILLGAALLKTAQANILNIIADHDKASFSNKIAEGFATGYTEIEVKLKLADEYRCFYFIGKTLTIDNQNYLIGTGIDISERNRIENEILATKNQLQATLDAIPDLLFELDLEGRYYDYHAHRIELLAAPPEQFLGKKITDILPAEAAATCFSAMQEALQNGWSTGKQIHLELSGKIYWFELSAAIKAISADSKELPHFIVLSRDITHRKEFEVAIAESRNLLRTVIDNVPVRVFWKDCHSHYLGCNLAFAQDAGVLEPHELIGKDDYQLVWKDQAELYQTDDRTVIASGLPKLSYDEPQTTLTGKLIWLRTSKVPLKNQNNKTIGVLGIYEDITERKQIEEKLKESEAMLKEAQEIAHLGHWILEIPENILYWSDEIYRIFGVQPQEFAATYEAFLHYVHPEDRDFVNESYRNHLNNKEGYAIEHRVLLKDGRIKYVSEKCKTEFNPQGLPLRSLGVVLDITERKLAEHLLQEKTSALLRSNADLEQFAYSVSHDMRQPLRSISGHLQLLHRSLKNRLDEDEQENLNFILDGVKRMDAMILSLLDYSRIGRKTENKDWINSKKALEDALDFLSLEIQEKHIEIKITGQWGQIFASHDELTRLFMNLISNAIKYREKNQPPVIEIHSVVTGKLWQVSLKDYGIGINPKQIDRLFQFFSRLQPRMRFEGTGMGLALCKRIIEQHHGRIWVESAGEGQGSCFKFELPLQKNNFHPPG